MQWTKRRITLFLDYDGTLHESLYVYAPAFRKAYASLVVQNLVEEQSFTDVQIGHWLGYPARDMWTAFQPQLSDEQWKAASQIVKEEMIRLSCNGTARLYPGALDSLRRLKDAGYNLIFLSNCSHAYMEAHNNTFHLSSYFDKFFCIGDYPVPSKAALYQLVAAELPGTHIMIGDRFHDLEVAQHFHLPFIGCRYGYGNTGELDAATICIDSVQDLPDAVHTICNKLF